MDRLETMTILLRVVDRGSFSAASRDLGVPLATVSRKVNELEAHLGTKLLVRTTRKVALTDAGSAYVASTRRILDEIDGDGAHRRRGASRTAWRTDTDSYNPFWAPAYPTDRLPANKCPDAAHRQESPLDRGPRRHGRADWSAAGQHHDWHACRIDADGGVCQPEAARGTGRTQISRGPRRLAVREFRALVTGLRLAVHADPLSPLSDHRRGGCLGCSPRRGCDSRSALPMCRRDK